MCFTAVPYEYRLMAVVVGFHCDVISCERVRRGVWHGAVEASGKTKYSVLCQKTYIVKYVYTLAYIL